MKQAELQLGQDPTQNGDDTHNLKSKIHELGYTVGTRILDI